MVTRIVLFTFVCVLFMHHAHAYVINLSPYGLVGSSDVMVVGTVTGVVTPGDVNVADGGKGSAQVQVERVLKGPEMTALTIANLAWMTKDHPKTLQPGQRRLLCLQRAQDGYILTLGPLGIRPPEEADTLMPIVQHYPFTMTITPPPAAYHFDERVTVEVTITNVGDVDLGILHVGLEGFCYNQRMERNLTTIIPHPEFNYKAKNLTATTIVHPGESLVRPVAITIRKPASWKDYTPDSYLCTTIALRANIQLSAEKPYTDLHNTYCALSPIVPAVIGFPPPKD